MSCRCMDHGATCRELDTRRQTISQASGVFPRAWIVLEPYTLIRGRVSTPISATD